MRMKAAVMHEQGLPQPFEQSRPFHIEEVDLDGPGAGEVLVEVRAAGICHSDLSQVKGIRKRKLPVVGGHEAAGIVREIGKGVTRVKVGDHVIMTAVSGCGQCEECRAGFPALCKTVTIPRTQGVLGTGARRLSLNGGPLYHYSGISGFAEYAVTIENSLVPIEHSVPLDVAAMFGCAVVTGAGAVFNTADIRRGKNVAVIGLGGVGLNAVMASKIAGAGMIIAIDMLEEKLSLAKELGATHAFLATTEDLVEKIRELTHGGVQYVFEVSGAKSAMKTAMDILRPRGEVIGIGLGAFDDPYQYNHAGLVAEEKAIRGCFMGSCVPDRDIPRFVGMFTSGQLPVDRLRSDTITLEGINRAFDKLASGQVVRQIILPHRSL
jgi:Zn-dependent alcohol dehydrogenase